MKKILYPRLDEQILWETLPSGLTVAVVPKPGFAKKAAYFVTHYGSIHQDFTLDGVLHRTPAGVAHYLEHKLFDLPGRDVTEEFAAMGAVVNAFTSFDMTAYYFSATEHFDECLRLLLTFVSTPYFTEETVAKEQGIIGQEIDMTADLPDTRSFELLAEALYHEHGIRTPILGTQESIAGITPQVLRDCHRAFYAPGNMVLCVVGDVDAGQVVLAANQVLGSDCRAPGKKLPLPPEPMTCREPLMEEAMEVAMPMFQIGFKDTPVDSGAEAIRREILGDLAAEALFGESSALYLRLYEEGLIDSSFGGGFETVDGAALLTCSGDSWEPEAVRDAVLEEARRIWKEGIPTVDFHRMQRSALGRRIRDLDSFDGTCFRICAAFLSDFDYFRFPELYAQITPEDIQEFLHRVVQPSRCAMSVILPIQEEEPQ